MPAPTPADRARILREAADELAFIDPNMHGLRARLLRALIEAEVGESPAALLADISENVVPELVEEGDLASAAAIEEFAARCFQLRNHHARIKMDAELDAIL